MKFGVCNLSVVPVRAEPADTSEMVTQVLFGELVVIQTEKSGWVQIRMVYDNYEGWADSKQIQRIDEGTFNELNRIEPRFTLELVDVVYNNTANYPLPVLAGSPIRKIENEHFELAGNEYQFSGQLSETDPDISIALLLENAMMFLNAPYLWGGRSSFGIDCSGFTQTVFKLSGIKLLRDASQQAIQGEAISLLEEALQGDLVFFDSSDGLITHVGIYIGDNQIIHASGKVRIDTLDHQGIYNEESKKYTHSLRLIKRII
ncbi:MAG: C40 family peptidase [Bacteroidales bacterium]|nr:C40 family peptidase [Bacteroidales bacterium]